MLGRVRRESQKCKGPNVQKRKGAKGKSAKVHKSPKSAKAPKRRFHQRSLYSCERPDLLRGLEILAAQGLQELSGLGDLGVQLFLPESGPGISHAARLSENQFDAKRRLW